MQPALRASLLPHAPAVTMLDFNRRQRALAADKLLDVGNVAVGGMVFGQFLADRPFSIVFGNRRSIRLGDPLCPQRGARRKEPPMIGLYILLGGIVLFATIVVVLDGISYRRKHRGAK